MGKKYGLEYDHIFPYSILKDNGYDINNRVKYALAQEITNRAVLTQLANRSKSAKMVEEYLADVKEKFPKSLSLQCIPEEEELWKIENFETFLETRRGILVKELNKFLENITETIQEDVHFDILEMIQSGENHHVEFKTTLRYDMRENKVNKGLEETVLRTIAAFSNGQGGTLILGVTDDYEIMGLENDYNTLSNGTKDGFELHLRNLLNHAYGIEFASQSLQISFPIVEEIEICVIEIKPWYRPLFSEMSDKYGIKHEKFYVRSGNSSPALPMHEITTYIRQRFDKIIK